MRKAVRTLCGLLWTCVLALVLAGCGGGGGGNSPGPGSIAPTSGNPGFSISGNSVALTIESQQGTQATADVQITGVTSQVGVIGAAYRNGVSPASWLAADVTRIDASTFKLTLSTATTMLAPGSYSTTLSVGALGLDQKTLLGYYDIAVTLTVLPKPGVVVQPTSVVFNGLTGAAAPAPSTLTLSHTSGQPTAWTLSSLPSWLQVSKTGGTTPDTVTLTPTVATDQPASLSGEVVITDAANRTTRVPVSVMISGPAAAFAPAAPAFSGVNGAPIPAQQLSIGLSDGTPATWTASSTAPWLQLSAGSGSSGTPLSLSIDAATPRLASGSYTASINVTLNWGSGRSLSTSVPVSLTLGKPTLSVSPGTLVLGGANGRDLTGKAVAVSLNTGSNAYGWSLTGLPGWLAASASGGQASASPAQLGLAPVRTLASPGTTNAALTLTAQVNGDTVTAPLPVTLNLDQHHVLPSENGVAFSSTPAWSRLTRSLKVIDNFGLNTGWSASADQPWLQATASGSSGGDLVLTANPAGLVPDSLYLAKVTLTPAAGDARAEVVRVGLWVGSATPSAVLGLGGRTWRQARPDPIRPYVYAHDGGTDLLVYNVYTGAEVGRVTNMAPALGSMAVASDGSALYAVDTTTNRVVPLNLDTLAPATAFALPPGSSGAGIELSYTRVNGSGILAGAGSGYVLDGTQLLRTLSGVGYAGLVHAFSGDGKVMATINRGLSPFSMARYDVDYTFVGGGSWLQGNPVNGSWGAGSSGEDVALAADGSRAYSASGAPYNFPQYDGKTLAQIGALPGDAYPVAAKVASDGRIFAAASVWYGPKDIWVYRPDGFLAFSAKASGYAKSVLDRQFWPSGDALMGIAVTDDPVLKLVPVGP